MTISNTQLILEFILVIFCSIIVTFSIIAAALYTYAYFKMKKSKIIRALVILLSSILIDSLWWLYAKFTIYITGVHPSWLTSPLLMLLVKGFLVVALINFVICSIRDDPRILKIKQQKSLFK